MSVKKRSATKRKRSKDGDRPEGCQHHPPCPNRRLCQKYSRILDVDFESGRTMIRIDCMIRGLRALASALEILTFTDAKRLNLLERAERKQLIQDIHDSVSRMQSATDTGIKQFEHLFSPKMTIH